MNKTSDIVFEIAQDIYKLGGEVDKLHEQYDNRHISEQVYYKKLYAYQCAFARLNQVVDKLNSKGYKFAKYKKEILILEFFQEDIADNLNYKQMNSTNFSDLKTIYAFYTRKYSDHVDKADIEELDDLNI